MNFANCNFQHTAIQATNNVEERACFGSTAELYSRPDFSV
jgi:hypothetical protein